MKKNYQTTLRACYLGFITQAITANFAPLLFINFHKLYNIPLGQIALISTTFFFTQLIVDALCAKLVDKVGYRKSIVASEICSALGLVGLSVLPEVCSNPFVGIIISVVLYAIGSGLIEVLCSPIVEACPFENKDAVMSLLHSFYCWGSVAVIALSTLFFYFFGIENWKIMAFVWALIPLYNVYNFAVCPIEHLVEEGQAMGIRALLKLPAFRISIVLMICAGACEIAMAQWASAYAEAALGLSKTAGDLAGPCMFAVTMGISRVIYGKMGSKINLNQFMLGSGILCCICYLLTALSRLPLLSLAGCIVCGFSVAIMWPGTISLSSEKISTGGTAMFALLALAGDLGGSLGPALVGNIAQRAGDDLHAGMLAGVIFPVIMIFALLKKEK